MLRRVLDSYYTRKIYNLFGTEIMASMAFKMNEVEITGTFHTFKLNEEGRSTVYVVKLNSSDSTITCTCKMFESIGVLCRHALKVLNVRNITKIPPQYILQCWRKDAKAGMCTKEHETLLQVKDKPSVTLRRNNLMRKAYDILSRGAESENGSRIAMQKLKEMEELIDKDLLESKGLVYQESNSNEVLNKDYDANENGCPVDETPVLDPPCVRPKGISNDRWKASLENKRKNAKTPVSTTKECDIEKQKRERTSSKNTKTSVLSSEKICTSTSNQVYIL